MPYSSLSGRVLDDEEQARRGYVSQTILIWIEGQSLDTLSTLEGHMCRKLGAVALTPI
jgi:hypothetical protein